MTPASPVPAPDPGAAPGSPGLPAGVVPTYRGLDEPTRRTGLDQARFLTRRGVDPARVVIGHSGDDQDVDHLLLAGLSTGGAPA